MPNTDTWFNVNKDIRVWGGHSDQRKQGWIYAPAAIYAIDEYSGSYKFREMKFVDDGYADLDPNDNYPDFWVRIKDVSLEPYVLTVILDDDVPVEDHVSLPTPISSSGDAALGAAFRLLVNFILGR